MRKIYWNNISRTSRFRPKYRNNNINFNSINFDNIIDNLKNRGIGKGSIIIVHSSYDLLEISGLLPEEINSKLLELVGTEGTLVMPAFRKYKEEGNFEKHIKKNMDDVECTYNVQKSKIITGLLPYMLMQRDDSFVSRFPLNPVVAVGKHAKKMIKKNLEGNEPTPHGPNSAWKYCLDNNAIIIGLGVDMPHFLTMTHVNEECSEGWPIKNWYRKRKFVIIDKDFKIQKEVLERKPIWGTIYLAENKYRKDLIRNNILKIETVEGLKISRIESDQLIHYLHNHSHKGFPYYVRSKFLK
ncbi:MAG: AAC(3) family N-acetyltransferase [Sediminibacterium sp.]|nr:AAC(3) family N-acetyltransferase [Sediminibacterium sp.]